jgi:hypothetical protein
MNTKGLAKHYDCLTPEERFRLILAAGARGDEAEQCRLINAGQRITFSVSDHEPYSRAFGELDLLTFIELLEEAAGYLDALHRADDAEVICGDCGGEANDESDGAVEEAEAEFDGNDSEAADEEEEQTPAERYFDLALGHGYVLKTKADGWKLFCERCGIVGDGGRVPKTWYYEREAVLLTKRLREEQLAEQRDRERGMREAQLQEQRLREQDPAYQLEQVKQRVRELEKREGIKVDDRPTPHRFAGTTFTNFAK